MFQTEKAAGGEDIHLFLWPQPSSASLSTWEPGSVLPCPPPAQGAGAMLQPAFRSFQWWFRARKAAQSPYIFIFLGSGWVFPCKYLCA